MAKYRKKTRTSSEDSGYESGYESDGGTEYSPVRPLGKGSYAQARLFRSLSKKEVTVLNPVLTPGDIVEARVKQRFFLTVYPDKQTHLFPLGEDYRLVVPYVPFIPYNKLTIDTPEFQWSLFRSAIQALKECHEKGIIVLDLKLDNIYYDFKTQKSYLIDGGLSVPPRTTIDPAAFQKPSQEIVKECKDKYWHIPPECWSVNGTAVLATPEMDIYTLGVLMFDALEDPDPKINGLIDRCLEEDPKKRPSLINLITSLESIATNREIREPMSSSRFFKDQIESIKDEVKTEINDKIRPSPK